MRLLTLVFSVALALSSYAAPKKILIYTHNGKGYVHDNIATSVEAVKKILTGMGYESESTDDPSVFTAEKLSTFACVIFSNTNNEAFDTEAQRQAFVDFIHKGGGFVGIHCASGSERQSPWFAALLGGRFVRHPVLQKFTIKTIDKQHSSTKFLPDTWEWEDECYFLDNLNPDIHVLLAADLTTIKDEEKVKYPGRTFGDYAPIAWYHEFEGGRQFYTALGHKKEYYQNEQFIKHLQGGIQWVLKKK